MQICNILKARSGSFHRVYITPQVVRNFTHYRDKLKRTLIPLKLLGGFSGSSFGYSSYHIDQRKTLTFCLSGHCDMRF